MLRLAPSATLLWRSPHDLQLGVDPPLAVLKDVRTPTLRLLARLSNGCERDQLDRIARAWSAPAGTVDDLLARLAPALVEDPPEAAVRPVVDGPHELVALLAGDPPGDATPSLVVLAAHHVIAPAHHLRWLRADVPHLPIVFADGSVTVGPLVEPGVTACLRCLDEHRIDEDVAWPALAAQLMRRRGGAAADPLTAGTAAQLLRRAVHAGALHGVRRVQGARVSVLPAPAPHPRCSCRGIGTVPGAA